MQTSAPAPKPEGASTAIALTEEKAAKAFALWEARFRKAPDTFLTADKQARMDVADCGTRSAIYFMALLREGGEA